MTKPDDIPQDVWDYAEISLKFVPSGDDNAKIGSVARAILAERGRCAKTAKEALLSLRGWPISEEQADEIAACISNPNT